MGRHRAFLPFEVMGMNWKKVLVGAILGAIGALTADTHSASQSYESWNWRLALGRACAGAVTGALAAAGLNAATQ